MNLSLDTIPLLYPFRKLPVISCRVCGQSPFFLLILVFMLSAAMGANAHNAPPLENEDRYMDSLLSRLPVSEEERARLKIAPSKETKVVATRGGDVYIYNDKDGKFEHWFSIAQSLGATDTVTSLTLDSMGKIWINTSKGVFIHVANDLCRHTDTDETDSVATPSDVKLFFTNIRVSGAPIIKGAKGEGKPLIGPIDGLSDITLSSPPNSFSLSVFTLGEPFSDPRYSWKLEGFDKAWSDRSSNCYINYMNLPAGNYTLMVRMYEGGRVAERSLKLTVTRPFWQSWWFIVLIIVALVNLVVGGIILYTKLRKLKYAPGKAPVQAGRPKFSEHSEFSELSEFSEFSELSELSDHSEHSEPSELSTAEDREERVKLDQNDEFLRRAEECVKENITNETFGKGEFASAMMISQSLLYKKIKAATDMSVVEFIRSIRLEHAKLLLKEGSNNVTEVSEMCGFSSSAYFSRVFKEYFGISPSEIIPK